MNEPVVPILDLSPKLNRPLSLRNPMDYLRLLYWAFFFPQALRWYVDRFCNLSNPPLQRMSTTWWGVRSDPIQRLLVIQAILAALSFSVGFALLLDICGVRIDWLGVALGILFSIVFCIVVSSVAVVTVSVAGSIVVGVFLSIIFGVMFEVAIDLTADLTVGIMFVTALGSLTGIGYGVLIAIQGGILFGITVGMGVGAVFGLGISLLYGVLFDVSLFNSALLGLAGGSSLFIAYLRPLEWLLNYIFMKKRRIPSSIAFYHTTPLPLPKLNYDLKNWLNADWSPGINNANQIVSYTVQFVATFNAINIVLLNSPRSELLNRVALLSTAPFDWSIVLFNSAKLPHLFISYLVDVLFFIPENWRQAWKPYYQLNSLENSPANAACAGFWLWYKGEAVHAAAAFKQVDEIPHGEELWKIASAINNGLTAETVVDIIIWNENVGFVDNLPEPELRSGTLATLRLLRKVAQDVSTAYNAHSPLMRSAVLGQTNATLTELLNRGADTCPSPEWELVERMTHIWREILNRAGGIVGEEILRRPVLNPYVGYSGLPVIGSAFIGRVDILRQIENYWATGTLTPVLIVYGHRRMGKTSILRNLDHRTATDSLLVYLDMQDSTLVEHSGDFLLEIAEAIYRTAVNVGLSVDAEPKPASFSTLNRARRSLNVLLRSLAPYMTSRRLILAIDEFELIETSMIEGDIDPVVLGYLRAINQEHAWLSLVFAGLHTLGEMGGDYQNAFYAQTEHVPVRYLSEAETVNLITQPDPNFALEYSDELLAELYRLTGGQPFLIQRLCWELVNGWNECFMEEGAFTPRVLELADLEPVLTSDFYRGASYYFTGVWENVTEAEQAVMRVLAADTEHVWTLENLAATLGEAPEVVGETLNRLRDHDVIPQDLYEFRFASELMRRWVAQHHAPNAQA